MTSKFLFSASLRVRHASMPARDVVDLFQANPKIVQSMGERRRTQSGSELPGIYDKTYVTFPLDVGIYDFPDDFLMAQFSAGNTPFVERMTRAVDLGCDVEYFFGCSCPGNSGFVLSKELAGYLCRAGVSLSFDIYGAS